MALSPLLISVLTLALAGVTGDPPPFGEPLALVQSVLGFCATPRAVTAAVQTELHFAL